MKVAIITSGLLPVPAIKGGAIETLLDSFIKINEKEKKVNLTIYSLKQKKIKSNQMKKIYKNTEFIYISPIMNLFVRSINKFLKTAIPINYFYQQRVINSLNKKKYDYIIVENYPELILKINSDKVIPYIHSDVLSSDTPKSMEIIHKAYKIFTVSNFIKKRVSEIDNSMINKVVTIYNSIDFPIMSIDSYNNYRAFFRKKYHLTNEIVFVFAGRISEEKGILELVKAFTNLKNTSIRLLIIGGIWYGSKKTNKFFDELKKYQDSRIIFTGYVNHEDINRIMCMGDIGVVPSVCNEAAGLSVVEFMRSRMLVVATNRGGIIEYINKQNNQIVNMYQHDNFLIELEKNLEKAMFSLNNVERNCNFEFSKKFTEEKMYSDIILELGGEANE